MPTTVEETEKTEIGEDQKDELLLDSLEIKGYRCFEHLTIEKLGRVNLIVGKNNVGKTALLEALWIYSQCKNANNIRQTLNKILLSRNETLEVVKSPDEDNIREATSYSGLFYNLPNLVTELSPNIKIGSKKQSNKVVKFSQHSLIEISLGKKNTTTCSINSSQNEKSLFIQMEGIDEKSLPRIWDEITQHEFDSDIINKVLESLNKIIPNKITNLEFSVDNQMLPKRFPLIDSTNFILPIPLKSYGEGMNRLFGIIIALIYCKNGILLIDEIESGLHYSVLPDVWKLIFKTAKDLNVQVFATTHSKDCIEAFAQAAVDSPEDGMLIRLERRGEKIVAKTVEEEMLADAVDYDVEMR